MGHLYWFSWNLWKAGS